MATPVHIACSALVICALLLSANPASASEASRADLVQTLSDEYGLIVDQPEQWEQTELASMARGAEALPKAIWEVVDAPITIERVDRPCMFSMGRYSDPCPTFGDDEGHHFFIYDNPPLIGEGPVQRLEILTDSEQRDVQLRRAIVHLSMVHADRTFGWSEHWQWRAINGWPSGDALALNRAPEGYSRYLGMSSSHLDLVTFAEEFFVRPEDPLLELAKAGDEAATQRLAQIHVDDLLHCQQFTKYRVFGRLLDEIDHGWSQPSRSGFAGEDASVDCPAFEQWANREHLKGFDLVYTDRVDENMESFFGSLVLYARYDDQAAEDGPDAGRHFRFAIEGGDEIDPFAYGMRRILGGLPAVLVNNGDDWHSDLRHYELHLTEEQQRRLLQRLWEAQRQMHYPYLFVRRNYASLLLELMAPVLDEPLSERRQTLVTTPDVLETLARQSNHDVDALLQMRPPASDDDDVDGWSRLIAPTGRNRIHLGAGWAPDAWTSEKGRGTAQLSYSFIDDRLGEPRQRGFSGERGVRLLGLDATIGFDDDALRNIQADLVVLKNTNLQRWRPSSRQPLGWEMDARLSHDGRRDLWAAGAFSTSLMVPLVMNSRGVNHLVVHGGAATRNDIFPGGSTPMLGGKAGLFGQLHLYGNYANILRIGVETTQFVAPGPEHKFDVRGQVTSRHAVLHRRQRPLVIAPYLEMLWTTRDYREEAPADGFQQWETGVRMELPF